MIVYHMVSRCVDDGELVMRGRNYVTRVRRMDQFIRTLGSRSASSVVGLFGHRGATPPSSPPTRLIYTLAPSLRGQRSTVDETRRGSDNRHGAATSRQLASGNAPVYSAPCPPATGRYHRCRFGGTGDGIYKVRTIYSVQWLALLCK